MKKAVLLSFVIWMVFACSLAMAQVSLDTDVYEIKVPEGYTDLNIHKGLSDNHTFTGELWNIETEEFVPFIGSEAGISILSDYFPAEKYSSATTICISPSGFVAGWAYDKSLVDATPIALVYGQLVDLPIDSDYLFDGIADITDDRGNIFVLGSVFIKGTSPMRQIPVVWQIHYEEDTPLITVKYFTEGNGDWYQVFSIAYDPANERLWIAGTDGWETGVIINYNLEDDIARYINLGKIKMNTPLDINKQGIVVGSLPQDVLARWQINPATDEFSQTILHPKGTDIDEELYSGAHINDHSLIANILYGSENSDHHFDRWVGVSNGAQIYNLSFDWEKYKVEYINGISNKGVVLAEGYFRFPTTGSRQAVFMLVPKQELLTLGSSQIVQTKRGKDRLLLTANTGKPIEMEQGECFFFEIEGVYSEMIPLSNFEQKPGMLEYRSEGKIYRLYSSGEIDLRGSRLSIGAATNPITLRLSIGPTQWVTQEEWSHNIRRAKEVWSYRSH